MIKHLQDKERGILFVIFVGGLLISILSLYNISNTTQMSVLNDEFGYWANAAYFYGYDWSGISFMSPYYSWGYSILLIPLFLIKNPVIRYQSALVINVVLYLGSYLISYGCIRKICPSLKQVMSIFICTAAALYSNNLLHTLICKLVHSLANNLQSDDEIQKLFREVYYQTHSS